MSNRQHIEVYLNRTAWRLMHWEFWPTWLVYLPVLFCLPYWMIRSRSAFFFSTVNPKMRMGGLYGASKYDALMHLSEESRPATVLFAPTIQYSEFRFRLKQLGLELPLIVKPDLGERGKGVQLVTTEIELRNAVTTQTSAFLVQGYLDLPFEAGVFYIKKPGEARGKVTSIVVKGFLKLVGDGQRSIEELALANKRSALIWRQLKPALKISPAMVLAKDDEILLEPIGNHSRGTAFMDGNHLLTNQLSEAIESLANQLPEFYYGRFDLRVASIEAFQNGEGLKIMEVNGANAEPAHIYHERASLWKGLVTLVRYWNQLFEIALANQKRFKPTQFPEALQIYRDWQNIKKEKWNCNHEVIEDLPINSKVS